MFRDLNLISNSLRKIIKYFSKIQNPHLGSCLSCIDILVYLYWEVLKINPKDSFNINRTDLF